MYPFTEEGKPKNRYCSEKQNYRLVQIRVLQLLHSLGFCYKFHLTKFTKTCCELAGLNLKSKGASNSSPVMIIEAFSIYSMQLYRFQPHDTQTELFRPRKVVHSASPVVSKNESVESLSSLFDLTF